MCQAPPPDDASPARSTIPEAAGWILDSAYSVLGPPFFTVGLMLFGLATLALAGFPEGGALLVLGAALALSGCPFSYVYACDHFSGVARTSFSYSARCSSEQVLRGWVLLLLFGGRRRRALQSSQ
jgi:hypothetical protein